MSLPREPQAVNIIGHGGIRLNAWDYGGEGTPLLFAHCTGTFGRIWDPVVAELEDAYRVIAPDTRGQGDSEAPPHREGCRWELSGHDLLAILDHFGFSRGIGAVGHSAGGAHVAYVEHLSPGTITRALLIDAVIADPALFQGENGLAVKVARRKNTFESREAARARLTGKPPMQHWVPDAVEAYLAHAFRTDANGHCHLKCPGTREAWYYEHGGAPDIYNALESLTFQAMLVTGDKSYAGPWIEAQHARLPRSRVVVVPDAGHFIPQEKPAETAALIRSWFSG